MRNKIRAGICWHQSGLFFEDRTKTFSGPFDGNDERISKLYAHGKSLIGTGPSWEPNVIVVDFFIFRLTKEILAWGSEIKIQA